MHTKLYQIADHLAWLRSAPMLQLVDHFLQEEEYGSNVFQEHEEAVAVAAGEDLDLLEDFAVKRWKWKGAWIIARKNTSHGDILVRCPEYRYVVPNEPNRYFIIQPVRLLK